MSAARSIYKWSAFLALPGGIWTAFEMYGLTLGGPQMLFFSIAHTLLPMVLAVYLSVPAGLLWLAQTLAALAFGSYRGKVRVPTASLAILAVTISTHSVALWFYEDWSGISVLRIPVCLAGLCLTAAGLVTVWRALRDPHVSAEASKT